MLTSRRSEIHDGRRKQLVGSDNAHDISRSGARRRSRFVGLGV
jgi:hypothetical protein